LEHDAIQTWRRKAEREFEPLDEDLGASVRTVAVRTGAVPPWETRSAVVRTLTELDFRAPQSPGEALFSDIKKKQQATRTARQAIQSRISALRADARSESEPFSTASEREFFRFLDAFSFLRTPLIALYDNGNIRALWENECGEQIGLQFLGNGQIQYVIFVRRADSTTISRSAGRDSFGGMQQQIASTGLLKLIVP